MTTMLAIRAALAGSIEVKLIRISREEPSVSTIRSLRKAVEQGGLLNGTSFGVPDRLGAEFVEPLVRKRSVIGQR
jgi:hypothetical protein